MLCVHQRGLLYSSPSNKQGFVLMILSVVTHLMSLLLPYTLIRWVNVWQKEATFSFSAPLKLSNFILIWENISVY